MTTAAEEIASVVMAEVAESRLRELEEAIALVSEIKRCRHAVSLVDSDIAGHMAAIRDLKKERIEYERQIHKLENEGLPKPDPQGKLPFVEGDEEEVSDAPEILALPISKSQKAVLLREGVKSMRDLIELDGGNWDLLEKGLDSVIGLNAETVKELREVIPTTAPKMTVKSGEPSPIEAVILVLNTSGGDDVKEGYKYRATIIGSGTAFVKMGASVYRYTSKEYEVV